MGIGLELGKAVILNAGTSLAMDATKSITEVGKKAVTNHLVPRFAQNLNTKITSFSEADKAFSSKSIHLPKEVGAGGEVQGTWSGERGNSNWQVNKDIVPKQCNKENKSFGEILKPYKVNSIEFKNGEPNFKKFSEATVKIGNFTDNRQRNFAQADMQLAKQRGISPKEAKEFRTNNNLTWHEGNDCNTLDLVNSSVHANIPHSGGISQYKNNY